MLKLSIVIPAHDERLMETSLVSILQNRPRDCEVVVVHNHGYADPYDLAGEVTLMPVAPGSTPLARLTRGLAACRSPVVHLLECGAEVVDGWTDAAVRHFRDSQVAAVAPLVLQHDRIHVESAGLAYRPGGVRIEERHGESARTAPVETAPTLGPTFRAAFYRRAAIVALVDPFSETVGDRLADVDLALRLARSGHRAVYEPQSQVVAGPCSQARSRMADAWLAERLFWRHAKSQGFGGAMVSHLGVLATEVARSIVRPWEVGRVVGRIAGCLEGFARWRTIAAPSDVIPRAARPDAEPATGRVRMAIPEPLAARKQRRDASQAV